MFTATLYNKTGFTLLNIPDSENTLNAAATSTKAVPAMDILQLLYNQKITIRAFENDVMYADYMKLTDEDNHKSAFYVINTYTMTSGDTIELDITMEPILTGGGISALTSTDTAIDGIVTRHHKKMEDNVWKELAKVSSEEDPLFAPIYPTEIELVGRVFVNPHGEVNETAFVMSSVDIDAANSFKYDIQTSSGLKTYVDANLVTGDPVNFMIPGKYDAETYETSPSSPSGPVMGAYAGQLTVLSSQNDMIDFRKKLVALMANKMTGIITDAYLVPALWASAVGAQWSTVQGHCRAEEIGVSAYLPDDVQSMAIQAYLGKYNEYIFVATASGNMKEINVENMFLYQDGGSVKGVINGMSDPRPSGGVDFAVAVKGNSVNGVKVIQGKHDILKGGNWYHIPIDVVGSSGASYNLRQFNAEQSSKDISAYANAIYGINSAYDTAFENINPMAAIKQVKDDIEQMKLGNYMDETSDGVDWGKAIAGGNDRMKALFDRGVERSAEIASYNNANAPQPQVVTSPSGDFDYYDHSVFIFKRNLREADRGRFTELVCRFGIRETQVFKKEYLNNRKYFNYIEGKGIAVNCPNNSRELNNRMSDALNGGVRIWHTKPSTNYYVDPAANPNAS